MHRILLLSGVFAMVSVSTQAQEWSPAQKEVWAVVQAYQEAGDKGDLEGYLAQLHEDYRAWPNGMPLPTGKAEVKQALSHFFPIEKVELSWSKPVSILVRDDVAFVHYYFAQHFKDEEGKIQNTQGRWLDVLVKENGKWLLIADHGGRTSN
jgi:ketosteroid isomerase-like protein